MRFTFSTLLLPLITSITTLSTSAYGVLQTIIIDDEYGDQLTGAKPTYIPPNGWIQGSNCTGCALHPSPASAVNGTWHDTTHHKTDPPRSVEMLFHGTMFSAYCIMANPSNTGVTSQYDLQFQLDGIVTGSGFSHQSDSSSIFQYNVMVFSIDGLSNATHNFTMSASSTTVDSLILFDHATYSFDDAAPDATQATASGTTGQSFPSPSPSSSNSTATSPTSSGLNKRLGVILGSVFGVLFFFLGAAIVGIIHYRRRKPTLQIIHPFDPEGMLSTTTHYAPSRIAPSQSDSAVEIIPTRSSQRTAAKQRSRDRHGQPRAYLSPGPSSQAESQSEIEELRRAVANLEQTLAVEMRPPPSYVFSTGT